MTWRVDEFTGDWYDDGVEVDNWDLIGDTTFTGGGGGDDTTAGGGGDTNTGGVDLTETEADTTQSSTGYEDEDWDTYRARVEAARPGATIDDQAQFGTWAAAKGLAKSTIDSLKTAFTGADGKVNWSALGGVAGALASASGLTQQKTTGGYAGKIPKYAVSKAAISYDDPNRRPGAAGRQYFTNSRYATDQAGLNAANTAAADEARGILSGYTPTTEAQAKNPYTKPGVKALAMPWEKAAATTGTTAATTGTTTAANTGASGVASLIDSPETALAWYEQNSPYGAAKAANTTANSMPLTDRGGHVVGADRYIPVNQTGSVGDFSDYGSDNSGGGGSNGSGGGSIANGLIGMAQGGILNMAKGHYLRGATDGMADKLPAQIDNNQPAALSHGEFVIPADVVSHLGNGNSDAGAKKLYQMMDRIRMDRTGTKKQGRQINPDKYMPGGIVGYSGGGGVQHFLAGGTPADTSTSSTLSPYIGDYVSDTLGKAQSLADQPYQAYKGPLTAGASDLQNQAFAGASNLATTGYTPGTFTGGTFDADAAKKYMNPFLTTSLSGQLAEQQRAADIARLSDNARLAQAGAFGGSRQAIMESEGRRNLLDKQSQLIGKGYETAYDKAMGQFNADQTRRMDADKAGETSRQYSATYGRDTLNDLAKMGATQRDIEQQGMDADQKEFDKQRDWDKQMQQYKIGLLDKLPISTAVNTANTNPLLDLIKSSTGTADFMTKWNAMFNPPAAKTN
jgi:hypothetical protein